MTKDPARIKDAGSGGRSQSKADRRGPNCGAPPVSVQSNAMLLAGDVGGTKSLIGLFEADPRRPIAVEVATFPTQQYTSFGAIIAEYLATRSSRPVIEAASFGVAGPVIDQRATLTNVPWEISAEEIAGHFGFGRVHLLNDLESMAWSVTVLEAGELATIQPGTRRAGHAALIAAGTGLGEAFLHRVGGRLVPAPSEGGHADFAPHTEPQVGLLRMLTRDFGRAEWEHVLSGPGLVNIHRFTHGDRSCAGIAAHQGEPDLAAVISRSALEQRCDACVEALQIFVEAYGAEAGNLALRSMARGGVFIGGGIAPKILPAMLDGTFVDAFTAKGPMRELLQTVPVEVILNPQAGLIGAAVHANQMA